MPEEKAGANPLIAVLWHLSMGAIIAYVFIIILITASAQASVAERLSRVAPQLGYSAAYAEWLKSADVEPQIEEQRKRVAALAPTVSRANLAATSASVDSLSLISPLAALHPRLSAIPECNFSTNTSPSDVATSLHKIRFCLVDADLSLGLRKLVEELIEPERSKRITDAAELWLKLKEEADALKLENGELVKQLQDLERRKAELKPVRESFGEIAVLQDNPLLGGTLFTRLPPSVVQILLAFTSGLFGSLLLTLVLIVYPNSDMKLGATDKGYGPRILLGGLISLCVFVVIGGGTAVLGTNDALADGQSNFLALCAIGILAGMFSDRVASWLSERADTFFKLSAHQAAAKAEGAAERAPADADAAAAHRDQAVAAIREDEAAAAPREGDGG